MVERTVSAALTGGLIDFAVAKGAERGALLGRSAIDPALLADRDSRIDYACYVALMRAAQQLSGDPALALHFGEAVDLADISVVGLISKASETMADALVQLNRYGKLVIDVEGPEANRFENIARGDELWMVDRRGDPNSFPELTEVTFARMICGVRRFAPDLAVHEVHVTHQPPPYASEYDRVLGVPVVFGAEWNAYRIDQSWLTRRLNLQPRYSFAILSAHADALLASLDAATSFRGRVESLLMPILHTGTGSIDRIASAMGASRQTLYRRLKAEDTTFDAVLDGLRHRLALEYLAGQKVSVNETAYLVGFSDPAAFSRAFKRWTGQSPGRVRRSLAS